MCNLFGNTIVKRVTQAIVAFNTPAMAKIVARQASDIIAKSKIQFYNFAMIPVTNFKLQEPLYCVISLLMARATLRHVVALKIALCIITLTVNQEL